MPVNGLIHHNLFFSYVVYILFIAENNISYNLHRQAVLALALELEGSRSVRYNSDDPARSASPEGFDCSGFVHFVITNSGVQIPDYIGMDNQRRPIRHASEFWDHYGLHVGAAPSPGDLIFFTRRGIRPSHMGILIDSETFIHAPGKSDTTVKISSVERLARRITLPEGSMYPVNPIGFKALPVPSALLGGRFHQEIAQ